MKTRTWMPCLACIMVALALSGLLQHRTNGQDKVAKPARTIWEYRTAINPDLKRLNDMGEEGWELAAIKAEKDGPGEYYFKRPVP
jgi:hypothetical protein